MRKIAWSLCAGAVVALAFGCGGAEDSSLLGDGGGGGNDGGGGTDGGGTDGGGGNCDLSRCPTLPDGFTPVRRMQGNTACPQDWASENVVTNPTVTDGACTCSCNVTTQPNCDTGYITRYLDQTTSPTCTSQATTLTANQGGCTAINNGIGLGYYHYSTNAPPPSGGACAWDGKVDDSKVSSTPVTLCTAPSSCPGAACDGSVCAQHDGDVACPSSLPNKALVGTSATANCEGCGASCSVSGTCTGKLAMFTDGNCTTGEVDFTADGTCNGNPTSVYGPYYSYSYNGSLQAADCKGPPPTPNATASLDGTKTICCQ